MADICVVHLVRANNGIKPFNDFLKSYKIYRSGIEHDLLIVFKGFYGKRSLSAYKQLLNGVSHKVLYMHDFGFDLRAYFVAVKKYNYKYFCFLNSFSTILNHEWLLKLYSHLTKQGIGIVGATGSYESLYTNFLKQQSSNICSRMQFMKRGQLFLLQMKYKNYFSPYPNYHIRSNGFIISRDLMRMIHRGIIITKMDAHRFESGKQSLTKQVLQMNLNALVVGKNGVGYGMEDWRRSGTFRQGEQNNLLIADNQTNAYLHSSPELKGKLSRFAWGNKNISYSKEI